MTSQLERFTEALFAGLDDGVVECRALPSRKRAFYSIDQLERVGLFAKTQRHENVYVGIATRADQTSGTLENCRRLTALYVDIDFKAVAEPEARARVSAFPFPPSLIVKSGGGLHCYWLLREPLDLTTDEPAARDGLRRLALHLGADLSVAECAHVLRLPDTLNHKYKPPARVVLEHCEPDRRYNFSELTDFLPVEAEGDAGGRFSMPHAAGVGDRHLTLFRAGRSLKARGLSFDAVLAALMVENQRVCVPPLTESQVHEQVDSAFKQKDRPGYEPAPLWAGPDRTDREPLESSEDRTRQAADVEPWLEPELVRAALAPVPALDVGRLLPGTLGPWVKDIAERAQCPADFVAIAAIVAAGALIGRRVTIRPKRHDDWAVVPNLWGLAIGRPGVLKSPALLEALRPLQRLVAEASTTYSEQLKAHRFQETKAKLKRELLQARMKEALKHGDDTAELEKEFKALELAAPVERRYLVNDATVEKLGELLNENPNGLLLFRDEISGFFRTMDREGHENDRAFYCEAWNGTGSYTYDRIGRGTIRILAACVSVLGGIQPGPLTAYLREAFGHGKDDDGLIQRAQLMVWPDTTKDWTNVDRWPDTAAKTVAFEIFRRLAAVDAEEVGARHEGGLPFLHFTPEAQVVFDTWRSRLEHQLRDEAEHPVLTSHLAKFRSLMPALALIFHLVDNGAGPVTSEAAEQATAWCAYLEQHARRVYQNVTDWSQVAAALLATKIRAGQLASPFLARTVVLKGWSGLSEPQDVAAALDQLEELHWVRRGQRPATVRGGRPTVEYLINPRASEGCVGFVGSLESVFSPARGRHTDKNPPPPPPSEVPEGLDTHGNKPTKPTEPTDDDDLPF